MGDWKSSVATARDATKVAVAVVIIAVLDLAILQHIKDPQIAEGVYRGLEWATVSVVMVSSTMMGISAATSSERILGTLCGGWLAFGLASGSSNLYFLAIASMVVAFVGFWIGNMYDLKYGIARLFPQTFLIVVFGSRGVGDSLLSVAVSRISGICFGVILYLAVCVMVFPSTASEKAMSKLSEGFAALEALNNIIWDSELLRVLREPEETGKEGVVRLKVNESSTSMRSIVEESLIGTEELTKQLDSLVAVLRKFDDYMEHAKSELYQIRS